MAVTSLPESVYQARLRVTRPTRKSERNLKPAFWTIHSRFPIGEEKHERSQVNHDSESYEDCVDKGKEQKRERVKPEQACDFDEQTQNNQAARNLEKPLDSSGAEFQKSRTFARPIRESAMIPPRERRWQHPKALGGDWVVRLRGPPPGLTIFEHELWPLAVRELGKGVAYPRQLCAESRRVARREPIEFRRGTESDATML
jgi:hypothetical protein